MTVEIWHARPSALPATALYGLPGGTDAADISRLMEDGAYEHVGGIDTEDIEVAWADSQNDHPDWRSAAHRSSMVGDVCALVLPDGARSWHVVAILGFERLEGVRPAPVAP